MEWGDVFHETHVPAEPQDIGFSTALVYCRACGCLLRSSRGMATGRRVQAPCEPVRVGPRAEPGAGPTLDPATTDDNGTDAP